MKSVKTLLIAVSLMGFAAAANAAADMQNSAAARCITDWLS
jgi:hypothetical protein